MCKVQMLRALVKQRLTAAAEEIFGLFERTIAEYEEELCRSKEENQRHRELLDAVFKPQLRLHRADVQQLSLSKEEDPPEQQERSPSLDQQDPAEPPHIKEEQEDLWTSQEGEQLPGLQEADGTKVPFTPVPVKSEEDEEKPQSSQLHQRLPEHMETGAAGEDCGGPGPARDSEPDSRLHPASCDKASDSSETDDSDGDWEETREPQSGSNSQKMNKVSPSETCDTGRKRFSCSECSETFHNCHLLKIHMRNHTGVHRGAKQEAPAEPPHIKEEQEDLWTSQEGEQLPGLQEADGTKVPFTPVPVKSEEDEEKPQSSQLHQRLPEHMETGAAGEDCGGPGPARDSEPDSHLHPDADEKTVASEPETEDSEDEREETREPQSGSNSLKNDVSISDERCNTVKKSLSCSECGKVFGYNAHLKRHMRIHTGEKPFSCSVCGKRFSRKGSLKQHMVVHSKEKRYSCSVCDKRFSWRYQLKRHKCVGRPSSRLHQAEPPASSSAGHMETGGEDCGGPGPARVSEPDSHLHPDADDRTDDRDGWKETREIPPTEKSCNEGVKLFRCSDCGKRFGQKRNLKQHMTVHSGVKRFSCSVCDKRFTWRHHLKRHKFVHPQDSQLNPQENKENPVSDERCDTAKKSFSCSECGKIFRKKGSLKIHLRFHTGEKPFCCSVCGKRFADKRWLGHHMAIHGDWERFTGLDQLRHHQSVCDPKQFHQTQTGQRFRYRYSVTKHARTHTKEKWQVTNGPVCRI